MHAIQAAIFKGKMVFSMATEMEFVCFSQSCIRISLNLVTT